LDEQIEQCLSKFQSETTEPTPKSDKKKRRRSNSPSFDLHSHLYRIAGVDFTTIDGLDVLTVQTIISEVGLDPSKFKTVKHFCSSFGLCPGCRITGGKVKSSQDESSKESSSQCFQISSSSR